jgi:hypothetical protein
MEYVQTFDLTAEYESVKAVDEALILANGWAYAVSVSAVDTLRITALIGAVALNVSGDIVQGREALAKYIWTML